MTKKLGRKPTAAEVDDKIAGMPGGVLLPEDVRICVLPCVWGVACFEKRLREEQAASRLRDEGWGQG